MLQSAWGWPARLILYSLVSILGWVASPLRSPWAAPGLHAQRAKVDYLHDGANRELGPMMIGLRIENQQQDPDRRRRLMILPPTSGAVSPSRSVFFIVNDVLVPVASTLVEIKQQGHSWRMDVTDPIIDDTVQISGSWLNNAWSYEMICPDKDKKFRLEKESAAKMMQASPLVDAPVIFLMGVDKRTGDYLMIEAAFRKDDSEPQNVRVLLGSPGKQEAEVLSGTKLAEWSDRGVFFRDASTEANLSFEHGFPRGHVEHHRFTNAKWRSGRNKNDDPLEIIGHVDRKYKKTIRDFHVFPSLGLCD